MGEFREQFLRRYATSPIHVPRLERMLEAYGDGDSGDGFARRFIAWDRACADGDAARIVTEVLAVCTDDAGRIVRLTDDQVEAAIRWMAEATSMPVAERARVLGEGLASRDNATRQRFLAHLESPSR
jgi:hypothetical protein